MGIWDTLKKAKNYVTGGGVKISISILETAYLRKPFKVKVVIQLENSEIEADRIFIVVKNIEHVKMQVRTTDSSGNHQNRTQQKQSVLHQEEILLDEMVLLQGKEPYIYESEVRLPSEVFPAFNGINAKLTWSLQAIIDKPGNNPESERLYFEPQYKIQ